MYKIILVDFPYIDSPTKSKFRPALALTKPIGKHKLVVVAYVTSHRQERLLTNVILALTKDEQEITGLKKGFSVIVLHKMASIEQSSIQGQIGILPQTYQKEVQKGLQKLFYYH